MIRPFAGVLDLGDGSGRTRALDALPQTRDAEAAAVAEAGELIVAASGAIDREDGITCIVDGGLYNSAELAAELGLLASAPPQAVLARGFRRWGSAVAERLRGEYGAVVWDERDRRGVLLQDQMGVRRVFFMSDGRRLWFASEVRDLLALLPSRPAPDRTAVAFWVSALAPPEGQTLYEGVFGLETGHLVEIDQSGWKPRRYWQATFQQPPSISEEELTEEIRASLRRSVAWRLPSDSPSGVLMSGGLDSTSVAALADDISDEGAVAFSTMFPNHPYVDESEWIEPMESRGGLKVIRHAAPGPGLLASGLEYLREWELPLHAWSEAWIQPLLRKADGQGVSVLLDGEGGDELFGTRYYLIADLLRRGRPLQAARLTLGLPDYVNRAPRKAFLEAFWQYGIAGVPPGVAERAWHRLGFRKGAAPWWASDDCAERVKAGGVPSWRSLDGPRWWAFHTHIFTTRLHGFGLLDHVRRRGEQAGLEARHPLLDLDLYELMMRIDPMLSSRGERNRPLLREAMRGRLPDHVRLRSQKTPFDPVMMGALNGPERAGLEMILGNATHVWDYADPKGVHELLEKPPLEQRDPVAVWASHVLRLAAIEVWLRYQEDPSVQERLLRDQRIAVA
jgi:asparagine synthase (glutamine-hydrolysing)